MALIKVEVQSSAVVHKSWLILACDILYKIGRLAQGICTCIHKHVHRVLIIKGPQ